jgi:glucokinase
MTLFVGVDIGGTKISVVLGDERARVLASERFSTSNLPQPGAALQEVANAALRMLESCGSSLDAVRTIGVACGGPLDAGRGYVLSPPNLPGWDAVPVRAILEESLHKPVVLENDANAAAVAEWQFGAGRGTRDMVFLTCSTGMGAGLILDGRLYRGSRGMAGESGHVRLTDEGPIAYGKAGSFEGWASGTGISAQSGRPADEVGRAALAGDPASIALIERAGEMLGRGIAIICDLLNPELVVCGTMAVRLGDLLLEPARRALARESLAPCPIVPSALGDDFGNKAALAVAISEDSSA